METLTTPYFNPETDLKLYRQAVIDLGKEKAQEALLPVFTENFHSQAWEITGLRSPYEFYYYIERDEAGERLVNGSDKSTHTDILDHTDKTLQNGLEYASMSIARRKMLAADIGTSVVWISPKNELYPDTQINIAELINKKLINVRQFQSKHLDLIHCAKLLNCVPDKEVVMTTIRSFNDHLNNEGVWRMIEDLTEVKLSDPMGLAESIKERSDTTGKMYLDVLDSGLSGEALKRKQMELLKNTIDLKTFKNILPEGMIATSCGFIDFGISRKSAIMMEVRNGDWCSSCQIKNSCTSNCYRCGGKLSFQPVSYN